MTANSIFLPYSYSHSSFGLQFALEIDKVDILSTVRYIQKNFKVGDKTSGIIMNMKKYPWKIAAHLAEEIQVRDIKAAQKTILMLIDSINDNSSKRSFEEVKLRVLQILTIASRAAYSAEANPDFLFCINIDMVNEIINLHTKDQLVSIGIRVIKRLIELVPDKNYIKTQKVDEAIQYIRENCLNSFSREDVAAKVGCSSSYLSKIFSDTTGRTFKEFVSKYRMEEAKKMLLDGKKSITEIAYATGYDDPNYFSTSFKKITGISPGKYRKYHS